MTADRQKAGRDARNAVAMLRSVRNEDQDGILHLFRTVEDPISTTVILAGWVLALIDDDPGMSRDEVFDGWLAACDRIEAEEA